MKKTISLVILGLVSSLLCFGQVNANLKGRTVVGSLPKPSSSTTATGTVVVTIKVDQYGNVTEAIPGAEGTTTLDVDLRKAARAAALKSHFNMSTSAPALQVGTLTYVFDGTIDEGYTSLKELVEVYDKGNFIIRAVLKEISDYSNLTFTVEQDDYIIPVRLVKKDLGAENRFRNLHLQPGDTLTIKGRLSMVDIYLEEYKGLVDASIIDNKEGKHPSVKYTEDTTPEPPKLIEFKPSFNGGDMNEFSKWVNSQLIYPESAKKNGIQGRVTIQFTIDEKGSVKDVSVLRGVDPALDAEAKRVVSSSPKWKPGRTRDKAVPVTVTFPVIFQLR